MGVKILSTNKDFHIYEYMIDSEADLSDIPFTVEGSVALAADTGDVYILNTQKEWKKI